MNKKLENIRYIKLPESLKADLGSLKLDKTKKLPIQLREGEKELSENDITVENIITGMLTVIAYDEANENVPYYKEFINTMEPNLANELNSAAIAKEQKKEYEFAEELFLAVYHLIPQPAACINLATLYSYMAVDARDKNDEENEFRYLKMAKDTLSDGLTRFGENEMILAELSSFEAYMGNLEQAKSYLERYLKVATDEKKKAEMEKVKQQIDFQLEYDNEIKEAYDFIMLGLPEKALPVIDKFIAGNPSVWNGHFLKGWALRIAKRYDEAEKELLECLKLGERNGEIYNELSICELEKGNRELSTAYLETAADLEPNSLSIMSNLAFMYLTDGNFDSARECLEKARYLSGSDELVKELIGQYESLTGEKIGELIHEEVVEDKDEDDDFCEVQEELDALNDDGEESECGCKHHHEKGDHHCCHHHHHHEHEENHECCCKKHHDNNHHCCHHKEDN